MDKIVDNLDYIYIETTNKDLENAEQSQICISKAFLFNNLAESADYLETNS